MESISVLEQNTGTLFSDLWWKYDDQLFEDSVKLFEKRLLLSGLGFDWVKNKTCLDAGCGGGRNSIAMARLGAKRVEGIDLGKDGLKDARKRARGLDNVEFSCASILQIPFGDESFDLVWCAGVLMITGDEDKALDELMRVIKPGGHLYLLVYATEGMRWPLIQWLRPIAFRIGKPAFEVAIERSGIPANKRRTFLDDLFCPRLDFYHWDRLQRMLQTRGGTQIHRWGPECRLDHESDLKSYREDIESLLSIFSAGSDNSFGLNAPLFQQGLQAVQATVNTVLLFEDEVQRGHISSSEAMDFVIGQGHHRVLVRKE